MHSVRKAEEVRAQRSSPSPSPSPNPNPNPNPIPRPCPHPSPNPTANPNPHHSLTLTRRARSGGAARGSTYSARARRPKRCCRRPASRTSSRRVPPRRCAAARAAAWACSRPTARGCSVGSRPTRRSSTSRPSQGCSSAGGAGELGIFSDSSELSASYCVWGRYGYHVVGSTLIILEVTPNGWLGRALT